MENLKCCVCGIIITEENTANMVDGIHPISKCKDCATLYTLINTKRQFSKEKLILSIFKYRKRIILAEVMLHQIRVQEALDDPTYKIPTRQLAMDVHQKVLEIP